MTGKFSLRFLSAFGLLAMIAAGGATPPAAQEVQKKHPVPAEKAQAKARDLIFDIFKDDLEHAKEPDAKSKLAAYLIGQGKESRDDLTNRYVLYIEATALAAAAGDAPLALSALDELARDFEIDLWQLKTVALSAAAANSPSKDVSKAQVDLLLPMIADAVEADNYGAAVALGKIAGVAAVKSKSVALVTTVQKRNEEVAAVQKGFAR